MRNAVPEPIFPEAEAYPSYRVPEPIDVRPQRRSKVDDYVLAAVIATGTQLVGPKRSYRKTTEV